MKKMLIFILIMAFAIVSFLSCALYRLENDIKIPPPITKQPLLSEPPNWDVYDGIQSMGIALPYPDDPDNPMSVGVSYYGTSDQQAVGHLRIEFRIRNNTTLFYDFLHSPSRKSIGFLYNTLFSYVAGSNFDTSFFKSAVTVRCLFSRIYGGSLQSVDAPITHEFLAAPFYPYEDIIVFFAPLVPIESTQNYDFVSLELEYEFYAYQYPDIPAQVQLAHDTGMFMKNHYTAALGSYASFFDPGSSVNPLFPLSPFNSAPSDITLDDIKNLAKNAYDYSLNLSYLLYLEYYMANGELPDLSVSDFIEEWINTHYLVFKDEWDSINPSYWDEFFGLVKDSFQDGFAEGKRLAELIILTINDGDNPPPDMTPLLQYIVNQAEKGRQDGHAISYAVHTDYYLEYGKFLDIDSAPYLITALDSYILLQSELTLIHPAYWDMFVDIYSTMFAYGWTSGRNAAWDNIYGYDDDGAFGTSIGIIALMVKIVAPILGMEIIPGITFGLIISTILFLTILFFVLRLGKGG